MEETLKKRVKVDKEGEEKNNIDGLENLDAIVLDNMRYLNVESEAKLLLELNHQFDKPCDWIPFINNTIWDIDYVLLRSNSPLMIRVLLIGRHDCKCEIRYYHARTQSLISDEVRRMYREHRLFRDRFLLAFANIINYMENRTKFLSILKEAEQIVQYLEINDVYTLLPPLRWFDAQKIINLINDQVCHKLSLIGVDTHLQRRNAEHFEQREKIHSFDETS